MQYYAYKQFTAFITPGSTILRPTSSSSSDDNTAGLLSSTVAAVNPAGLLVIVAVNPQASPLPVKLRVDAQYGTACATVHMTNPTHAMEDMGIVPLDSSKTLLETLLASESITTFVFDPSHTAYVHERTSTKG